MARQQDTNPLVSIQVHIDVALFVDQFLGLYDAKPSTGELFDRPNVPIKLDVVTCEYAPARNSS